MQKMALVIVLMLLTILATHTQAITTNELSPQQKTRGKIIANPNKNKSQKSTRAATYNGVQANAQTEIHLFDVWFDLLTDSDGDGYYAKLNINFDLDTIFSEHEIYVVGQLDNQQLFKTDAFTLHGNSGDDSYQTTVLLTEGYSSNYYDLTLIVYDAETNQMLVQYSSNNNDLFEDLYLEDAMLDDPFSKEPTLYSLSYQLGEDWDGDGYYTQISIAFDVDAANQTRWIYSEIFLIDLQGYWHPLSISQPYEITHYDDHDAFQTTLTLDTHFEPKAYQVAVRIYDNNTHALLLTSIAPNSNANMESIDWDNDFSNSNYGEDSSTVIVEEETYYASGSGGSMGIVFLSLLGLLVIKKRLKR